MTNDLYHKKLNNSLGTLRYLPNVKINGTSTTVERVLGCDKTEFHPYGDYYRMVWSDRKALMQDHPLKTFFGWVFLLFLLTGSHSISMGHHWSTAQVLQIIGQLFLPKG